MIDAISGDTWHHCSEKLYLWGLVWVLGFFFIPSQYGTLVVPAWVGAREGGIERCCPLVVLTARGRAAWMPRCQSHTAHQMPEAQASQCNSELTTIVSLL